MSDIKVGDLVMVVRAGAYPCGCKSITLGRIFTVTTITLGKERFRCGSCNGVFFQTPSLSAEGFYKDHLIETYRLKRIPPLSELESAERQEREPAHG